MRNYICTIFTDSHIAQALTLWESVFAHSAGWKFIALRIGSGELSEKVPEAFCKCCIGLDALDIHPGTRFWYDAFEFCNFAKAPLHKYMARIDGIDEWWYVDADCQFVGSPDALSHEWRNASIMLSPHRRNAKLSCKEVDLRFLFYGVMNGGLLGLRPSPTIDAFLDWFTERLTWMSFREPNLGMYVDQRWLDLVPSYFEADFIQGQGINVGHWNFSEQHVAGDKSLTLLHFSNINLQSDPVSLGSRGDMNDANLSAFLAYAECYCKRIAHWKEVAGPMEAYPFNAFGDGSTISKSMRRAYYCDVLCGTAPDNPFADSKRYAKVSLQFVNKRFLDIISPYGAQFASKILTVQPSVRDVLEGSSVDELARFIDMRHVIRILGRKVRSRLSRNVGT